MVTFALLAGTIATGLIAGLFFGYACSVVPALSGVDDTTYVDVMRRINRAIQNPAFGLCFLAALLLPGVAVLGLRTDHPEAALWTAAGLAAYLGSVLITVGANIPRNQRLDRAVDPSARQAFEGPWNRFHLLRTLLAVAAFALLCRAVVAL